jgi:hypothetical protein
VICEGLSTLRRDIMIDIPWTQNRVAHELSGLEIGQSIFIRYDRLDIKPRSLTSYIHLARRSTGREFICKTRTEDGAGRGMRIWAC